MASTYNHPQNFIAWFIKGNHLAVVTVKGELTGSYNKKYGQYKPINESVTNGLLIHYYAEPDSVTSVTDSLEIDNTMHLAIVDYVKKCLYMDKAGVSVDGNVSAMAAQMARMHEKNFNDAIIRYGMKKRDKTGGSRVLKSISLK